MISVRRALDRLLLRIAEWLRVRAYVAGYRAHPETHEEVEAASATGTLALAEEPWD